MKKLKIAQISPLWLRIPPVKYGGIEWVVYNLCEGLAKKGHQVTLFASGDSLPPPGVKLVSVYPRAILKDKISWKDNTYNMLNLSYAFKRDSQFDIMHTHIDLWDIYFAPLTKKVCLHTIHNPLYSTSKRDSRLYMMDRFKNNNYVAISQSQKKLSRAKLNFCAVIYNGIRTEEFKFNAKPQEHFVWAARIDKYKGIENAIKIAQKAKIKLVLAGRLDPSQRDYFNKKIKPHLNSQIKFIGEYSRSEKSSFYRQAKALIYPIEWHEPFGLNMTESMATGTPVIAYRKGSVPEVVKHNQTGFIVNNIEEAVKAVKKIEQIKREDCREWVEKNFSREVMVEDYEKLYFKLLKKKHSSL